MKSILLVFVALVSVKGFVPSRTFPPTTFQPTIENQIHVNNNVLLNTNSMLHAKPFKSEPNRQHRLMKLGQSVKKRWVKVYRSLRRGTMIATLALSLWMSVFSSAAMADVRGGRMGGSFGRSSGGSARISTRGYGGRSSGSSRIYYRPPRLQPRYMYAPTRSQDVMFRSDVGAAKQVTRVTQGLVLGGIVGYVVLQEQFQPRSKNGSNVISLTVSLSVPDRNQPGTIIDRLTEVANASVTSTREGVAQLLQSVALEVLRKESSWTSATFSKESFRSDSAAQQKFNEISTMERAKLDSEAINKFGDLVDMRSAIMSDEPRELVDVKATLAVVTLNWAITSCWPIVPASSKSLLLMEPVGLEKVTKRSTMY